jgi:hypothetical protein
MMWRSRTWILNFRPFLTKAAFLRSTLLWYHSATPDSEEKPSASHMCARIKLHTYDRQKSVISLTVFKRITELPLITLMHETRRSLITENDNYLKSLRLPLPQALDWGTASLKTHRSRWSTCHHCSPLNNGKQGWVHLWFVLNKWGKMQGY